MKTVLELQTDRLLAEFFSPQGILPYEGDITNIVVEV